MSLLHIIRADEDNTYESKEWTGELEYACPPFSEIRKLIGLEPDSMIEHVAVLWKGKRAHMFVDEIGAIRGLPRNERATRIYYNATISRRGLNRLVYVYDDLTKDPYQQILVEEPGFQIVGTAALWEGDME